MSCKNGKKIGQNYFIIFWWTIFFEGLGAFALCVRQEHFSPSWSPYELCPQQQLHLASVISRPHRKFPSLICVGQGARMYAGSHGRAIALMLQHIASLSPAFLFTLLAPSQVASPSSGQRRPFLSLLSWKSHCELCRRCVCLWKWPAFEICWPKLSTWLLRTISHLLLQKCHFLNFPQVFKQLTHSHTHNIRIQETEKLCHTCPF